MTELTKREAEGPEAKESGTVEAQATHSIELEGFNHEDVQRMLRVKQAIANGRYTDVTAEHRKLLFVQWLIEHDKLGS